METSNANQNFGPDNPVWVLIAERSLRDFLSDHDREEGTTVEFLFQTLREWGIPLECVENIARLVSEFAKESPVHSQQEGLEFPACVRIFCQKEIIDEVNATRPTSRAYPAEPALEHSPMILDSGTKMNGGWGCFLIQRGGNISDDASLRSHHLVDVYLYREG